MELCNPSIMDQHTTGKCPPGDHSAAGMRKALPSANCSTIKSHLQNARMLLEARKHWCKPSLLPYEVLQGPRGPLGSVEEVHLALGPLFLQEPPKCSSRPNIAWSFPQEGPCFLKWGWNVPESPCLTLLCIVFLLPEPLFQCFSHMFGFLLFLSRAYVFIFPTSL